MAIKKRLPEIPGYMIEQRLAALPNHLRHYMFLGNNPTFKARAIEHMERLRDYLMQDNPSKYTENMLGSLVENVAKDQRELHELQTGGVELPGVVSKNATDALDKIDQLYSMLIKYRNQTRGIRRVRGLKSDIVRRPTGPVNKTQPIRKVELRKLVKRHNKMSILARELRQLTGVDITTHINKMTNPFPNRSFGLNKSALNKELNEVRKELVVIDRDLQKLSQLS